MAIYKKVIAKLFFALIFVFGVLFILVSMFMLEYLGNEKLPVRFQYTRSSPHSYYIRQHGKYWVMYNFLSSQPFSPGSKPQNITLVTHGTYEDLRLLEGLTESWQAPINMTLFTNGRDFEPTMKRLQRLYKCSRQRRYIEKHITFNLCFHEEHFPVRVPHPLDVLKANNIQCDNDEVEETKSYWQEQKLDYPINLLQNIGRESITTRFIFPIEIDYWPMNGFVEQFMRMINTTNLGKRRQMTKKQMRALLNKVFCVPILNYKWETTEIVENPIQIQQNSYQPNKSDKYFVGAQQSLPPMDERINAGFPFENDLKFEVLKAYKFNFTLLTGTGVRKVGVASYKRIAVNANARNIEHYQQLYEDYLKQWTVLKDFQLL